MVYRKPKPKPKLKPNIIMLHRTVWVYECVGACVWVCVGVEYAATAIRHASARGKFVDLVCGIWGIWFGLKSQVPSLKCRVPSPCSARREHKERPSSEQQQQWLWHGMERQYVRPGELFIDLYAHTQTHTHRRRALPHMESYEKSSVKSLWGSK